MCGSESGRPSVLEIEMVSVIAGAAKRRRGEALCAIVGLGERDPLFGR